MPSQSISQGIGRLSRPHSVIPILLRARHSRSFTCSPKQQKASDWSAVQYLKFEDERTRPVRDLLAQIPLQSPKHIVDLGCGPGNSTAVLAARYPHAHLEGIDSSPDMIKKAREVLPNIPFSIEDLNSYVPNQPVDLFFSNAVFQWLPYADRINVIARLIQTQPSGGVFALQVPDNFLEPSHSAMRDTATKGRWAATLDHFQPALDPFQSVQELYNHLKPLCSTINMWHTHYHHVLENHEAIVEWVKGTGLRPFIDPLSSGERGGFLEAYLERLKQIYPISYDGKVVLRYPRLFVVAVRA
ncbi:trans-aconitate methyltransferase [Xylona heveae TC161]|uniref:Trans-aconitate methyltransferase n=1 Tax=Xylona heveae (strain CBS 132557 / TC161) TaxID=1328760 RepID=A0A165K4B1_XYLHT|nr:trans-aconitate methyltransferase [Xylona heveae TC161]KZF26966.1 trans-aconitate methyltransferase [Xylona heveae TC161]